MLDEAGDLNEMIRVLMSKTFYELDYEFYQIYPDIAATCGSTILCLLIIDSKIYSFNLGDNRGLLYRDEQMFKLNIDHIPVNVILYRVELMRKFEFNRREALSSTTGLMVNARFLEHLVNSNTK